MDLFAKSLNQLGEFLLSDFGGSFSLFIEKANHSAETLVLMLAQMPFFVDIREYRGIKVPFYKRAQIMASDLYSSLNGQGLGYFPDIALLTCFADNLVPHVLRTDGVLEYILRYGENSTW
jgi:hypothetical protein